MTKFSRSSVRNPAFGNESEYIDTVNKYKKEDLGNDDRREFNDRRKKHRGREIVAIAIRNEEDRPVARRTKPPGAPRNVLNGKRSDQLSKYDQEVLDSIDEDASSYFSFIPADTKRIWYRQAFSAEIRSAKALRKDPPGARKFVIKRKGNRPKNHLAAYVESVHSSLVEFVALYAHDGRHVWDIVKGCRKGAFPRSVRDEVIVHAEAAKTTFFSFKEVKESIGEGVLAVHSLLLVGKIAQAEAESAQRAALLTLSVAQLNLRAEPQLNGSNGECTGKDDVESGNDIEYLDENDIYSPCHITCGPKSLFCVDGCGKTITFVDYDYGNLEFAFYTRRIDHDLRKIEELLLDPKFYRHGSAVYDMSTYLVTEVPINVFFWCRNGYLYMLDTIPERVIEEVRQSKYSFLTSGNYHSYAIGERSGIVTRGAILGGKGGNSFSKIMHEAESLAKQGHNAQRIREILQQRHPKTSAKDLAKVAQGVKRNTNSTSRPATNMIRETCGVKRSSSKTTRRITSGPSQLRSLGMSQPARQYLATITTPHCVPHNNVRVPLGYGSTQAVTVRSSFDVGVSSTGTGFVAFTPSADSIRDSVQYTTSSYAGLAAITRRNSATTGVASAVLTLPYTNAQLTASGSYSEGSNFMQYRLVAVGATMSYVGSELNRGGIVYAICHPRNDDISNITALGLYQNYNETVKYNINTTDKFEVTWHGRNRFQLELIESSQASLPFVSDFPSCIGSGTVYWDYSTGTASSGGCCFGFIIADAQPSATFTVEVTEHWEFAGQNVGLLASPIISDEGGVSRAHSIAQESQLIHAQQPHIDRTSATVAAIGNVVTGLEPELAMMATAYGGPEMGAAVETGINAYKKVQGPINHIVSGVARDVRKLFNF